MATSAPFCPSSGKRGIAMSRSTLALLGGDPAHSSPPADYPRFSDDALRQVSGFLRHEHGLLQGLSKHHEIVREFEEAFAAYHEMPYCLATSSGHGALQSALIGLEITAGDHVLTSPYSWGASVSCILHNNAVPVFADIDPATGLLDPEQLSSFLTPQTTAILVPHIYGQPADMTSIMAFARTHGLLVIEDGSQAHGAVHRGRPVGSFGDASGFSINGVKPLATTEGGYLLTKDPDAYWKVTISCQHAGRSEMLGRANEDGFPDELRPFIDSLVYTYRPICVSAILGLDRLGTLEHETEVRREHVHQFLAGISGIEFLNSPSSAEGDECVYYMLTLNFDAQAAGVTRDTFLRALQAEGVPAVAYVDKSLHASPRLSPDWSGPRVMWTGTLRRSGVNPNKAQLPGCEAKVAHSIEIPWNYAEPQPEVIESLVDAFRKVADHIPALRAYDDATAGSAVTHALR
jgi:dTDP-4-amino-4,6-dideoxygalactose transaminase